MADQGERDGEELEVEEPDCDRATAAILADEGEAPDQEPALSAEDRQALDAVADDEELPEDLFGGGLGPPGGGWGGASAPVDRAWAIGRRNRLTLTSRKRSSDSTGSDHHTSQKRSDAADMSNGSSPTPQMDRTAAQIAALLGVPNWRGGVLERTQNGYRVQLLYRTKVGGDHFNHVHVGVRMRP